MILEKGLKMDSDDRATFNMVARWVSGFLFALVLLCSILAWGCPQYHVWQQGLLGEAELRRAEQNRKITVQEAEAKKEAATLLATAEVERAKGVAAANQIIGEGLKDNHDYLIYLWIQELANAQHVIYVPTEASLPILEANRFKDLWNKNNDK